MIRLLAATLLTTAAPVPIVVHLSPTQTCVATDISYLYSGGVPSLDVTGLVCPPDTIFRNGFEPTGAK